MGSNEFANLKRPFDLILILSGRYESKDDSRVMFVAVLYSQFFSFHDEYLFINLVSLIDMPDVSEL